MNRKQLNYLEKMTRVEKKFYNYFILTHNISQFLVYKHIIDISLSKKEWVDVRLNKISQELEGLVKKNAIFTSLRRLHLRKEIIRLKVKDERSAWYIALPDINNMVKNNTQEVPFMRPDKELITYLEKVQDNTLEILQGSDIFNLSL